MGKLARLFVAAVIVGLLAPLSAHADGRDSRVRWQPCYPEAGASFECASVRVPLDYDRPLGRRISLALARLPATDPKARRGSIFLNPGGPGASGGTSWSEPAAALQRRGAPALRSGRLRRAGSSAAPRLTCFKSFEDSLTVFPPFAFRSRLRRRRWWRARTSSTRRASAEAARSSTTCTADVARDPRPVRRRSGTAAELCGYSYGSFLGVTYANLFPRPCAPWW